MRLITENGIIHNVVWELALCLLAAVLFLHPIQSWDIWWQIRTGEFIVTMREIPLVDPFSFTVLGKPWINHEWGAETLFYVVFARLGAVGLILLKVAVLEVVVLLLWRNVRDALRNPALAAALTALATWVIYLRATVRPHIFTLLFLSVVWAVLLVQMRRDERDDASLQATHGSEANLIDKGKHRDCFGRIRSHAMTSPDWLWFVIPVVQLAWVNLHGGAFLGITFFAIILVGELIGAYFGRGRRPCWQAWAALALAVGAMFANPFTWRTFTFPFEHYFMHGITDVTEEWQSPFALPWRDLIGMRIWMALMATSVMAIAMNLKRLRFSLILCAVAAIALGLSAIRNSAISLIIILPIASNAFFLRSALLPDGGGMSAQRRRRKGAASILFQLAVLNVIALGAVAMILVGVPEYGRTDHVVFRPVRFGIHPRTAPFAAVDFLKENAIGDSIFNDLGFGGFLILNRIPVFIDGRTPLYGEEFFVRWRESCRHPEIFDDLAMRYDIDSALLMRERVRECHPLHEHLLASPAWIPVFADDKAIVYLRDVPSNAGQIERLQPVPEQRILGK